MTDVPIWRLYLLRAYYLVILVGLAIQMWPPLVHQRPDWPLMNSVVVSMLTAVSLLAALGLRYPLQMLPILLFELVWKTIWLLAVGLPLWTAGRVDADVHETIVATLAGVVLTPIALPWRYLWDNYLRKPGDRWLPRRAA